MFKKILKKFLFMIPLRNIILFESVPDLSDNTKPIFDELIKRHYNEKYCMVWLVSNNHNKYPQLYNVKYLNEQHLLGKIKYKYYTYFAKCKISCNSFLTSTRKGQISFYITHGTAIKSVRGYYNVPDNIDYILVDGEKTKEIVAYEIGADIDKVYALGYPRNDVLTAPLKNISTFFPNNKDDKIIIWYPTYRHHKNLTTSVSTDAIPILHSETDALYLNEIAKKNNTLLIIKPHFAQDISKIKSIELSNIKFIDDNFYLDNSITSYEFIAACDALLTDYSSVYYDFLLCNKPIGLIWEDYEEYKEAINFAVDMDYYMKAGVKIYNLNDLEQFIKDLACGKDYLINERAEISEWANLGKDGKNSERVANFIIKMAAL